MAVVNPTFFDTSVLVAGLIELGETGHGAQRILDGVAAGEIPRPHTAWHCCLEFYSVSTRLPEEFRLSPGDALRLLEEEILPRFQIHQLPEGDRKEFLRYAVQDRVMGGRIYDAHIAHIARSTGVQTVVTENRRHFTSLLRHGIRVLTASEFVDELPSVSPDARPP